MLQEKQKEKKKQKQTDTQKQDVSQLFAPKASATHSPIFVGTRKTARTPALSSCLVLPEDAGIASTSDLVDAKSRAALAFRRTLDGDTYHPKSELEHRHRPKRQDRYENKPWVTASPLHPLHSG